MQKKIQPGKSRMVFTGLITLSITFFLNSCSYFNSEVETPSSSDRYEFLKKESREHTPGKRETREEEAIQPSNVANQTFSAEELDRLSSHRENPIAIKNPQSVSHFYDDFLLMDDGEELTVSLIFNSAPLADVLPAFADVLGFNFIIDPEIRSTVTVNLNSMMTRRELFETLDKMLTLAGCTVKVDNSLLRIIPVNKLVTQPDITFLPDGESEVCYYTLKNTSAASAAAQLRPFLSTNATVVELTDPNALLLGDDQENMPKVRQLLDLIDRSSRGDWPRAIIQCRQVLPSRMTGELSRILPVLGLQVTEFPEEDSSGNRSQRNSNAAQADPGSVQLTGVDRLQLVVVSAATEEAISMIREWIAILDQSAAANQEQLFVYKVAHNKATQLVEALSVLFDVQGSSLTVDSSTGDNRTDTVTSTNRNSSNNNTLLDSTTTDVNSSVFSTPVRVFADGVLNRLVIRTTPRTYATIKALLDRLDVVPAQVLLQVLVVEVTLNKSTEFGLEFSYSDGGQDADNLLSTNFNSLHPENMNQDAGFRYKISNPNNPSEKFGYLKAMAGNNDIKVISSPQLLVSSHTEAMISVGKEVPVITGGISDTASSANNSVIQSYDYKDTGIILTVTPEITSTDLISLELTQTLSEAEVNTTSNTIDSPVITNRELQTSMTIANGQTMIIGGLIQEKKNKNLKTIPIVGEIPFLGELLGNLDKSTERSEILVMITGYIVNEQSPVEEMIQRYNQALSALNEFESTLGPDAQSSPRRLEGLME